MRSGNLNFLEPSGPLQACNGTALPISIHMYMCRKWTVSARSYIIALKWRVSGSFVQCFIVSQGPDFTVDIRKIQNNWLQIEYRGTQNVRCSCISHQFHTFKLQLHPVTRDGVNMQWHLFTQESGNIKINRCYRNRLSGSGRGGRYKYLQINFLIGMNMIQGFWTFDDVHGSTIFSFAKNVRCL